MSDEDEDATFLQGVQSTLAQDQDDAAFLEGMATQLPQESGTLGAGKPREWADPATESFGGVGVVGNLGSVDSVAMAKPAVREAVTFADALESAVQGSNTGLAYNEKLPTIILPENASMAMKFAHGLAGIAGDLPTLVTGAMMAAPAAAAAGTAAGAKAMLLTGNPFVAAGAGVTAASMTSAAAGMALTEFTRAEMIQQYRNGSSQTFEDFWVRKGTSLIAGLEGAAIGAAAELTGGLVAGKMLAKGAGGAAATAGEFAAAKALMTPAQQSKELLAKVATMVTVGAGLRGQAPSLADFVVAAGVLGVAGVAHKAGAEVQNRMMDTFVKKGLTPAAQVALAEESAAFRASQVSGSPDVSPVLQVGTTEADPNIVGASAAIEPLAEVTRVGNVSDVIDPATGEMGVKIGGDVVDPVTGEILSVSSVDAARFRDVTRLLQAAQESPDRAALEAEGVKLHDPVALAAERDKLLDGLYSTINPVTGEILQERVKVGTDVIDPGTGEILQERVKVGTDVIDPGTGEILQERAKVGTDVIDPGTGEILQEGAAAKAPTLRKGRALTGALEAEPTADVIDPRTGEIVQEVGENLVGPELTPGQTLQGLIDNTPSARVGGAPLPAEPQTPGQAAIRAKKVAEPTAPGTTMEYLMTQMVDFAYGIETVERKLNAGDVMDGSVSPHKLLHLALGHVDAASVYIKNNLMPTLKAVGKDVFHLEDYLMAKNALEMHALGKESGIDHADAVQTVKNLGPRFDAFAQEVYKYESGILQMLVDSGYLGQGVKTAVETQRPSHVPFRRLLTDAEMNQAGGPGSAGLVRRQAGSARDIVAPFLTIARKTVLAHKVAMLNKAQLALVDLADRPGAENLIVKVPRPVTKVRVTEGELTKIFEHFTLDTEGALGTDPLFYDLFRRMAPDEPNMIAPRRAGVPEYWRITPMAALAYQAFSPQQLPGVVRLASTYAIGLRVGATTTLDFIKNNIIKDMFSAAIAGDTAAPLTMAKGFLEMVQKGTAYEERVAAGGGGSSDIDLLRLGDFYANGIADPGRMNALVNRVKTGYEFVRAASAISEEMTKQGTYDRLAAEGSTVEEAAIQAARINIDKRVQGAHIMMRVLNAVTAFQNTRIQGTITRTRELALKDPVGLGLGLWYGVAVPSILLTAYNLNHPMERAVNRREADNYHHIHIPQWRPATAVEAERFPPGMQRQETDGNWQVNVGYTSRQPIPEGLGVVVNAVIKRTLKQWHNEDPRAFDGFVEGLFSTVNPIGLPTFAVAPAQRWANKDFFYGTEITPRHLEGRSPPERFTADTTELSKTIARAAHIIRPTNAAGKAVGAVVDFLGVNNPSVIDMYVRTLTGGAGRDIYRAVDAMVHPQENRPDRPWYDYPGIRGTISRYPSLSIQPIQDFEARTQKLDQAMNDLEGMQREGRFRDARALAATENLKYSRRALMAANGPLAMLQMKKDWIRGVSKIPASRMSNAKKRENIETMYIGMWKVAEDGNRKLDEIEERLNRLTGGTK